jgi:hypothetical protein
VILIGVFALVALLFATSVRYLAAGAASTAADFALEIAQSPDGSPEDARQVAERLAKSTLAVNAVHVVIRRGGQVVTVSVAAHGVLGGTVTKTVSGPLIGFVTQGRRAG